MQRPLPPQLLTALRRYQPERVILFGSSARGDADAGSDIDLLLIKETPKLFLERLKEFAQLLPADAPRVDVFIYTQREFEDMRERESPFLSTVLADGITIYEAPQGRA